MNISHYKDEHQNKLEIFSEEIGRDGEAGGAWRKNDCQGTVLVVLIYWSAQRHDENRVKEEVRRSRTVVYCLAIGKVEKEGEDFRVTLTPKASKEWQRIETEKRVGLG